MAQHLKIKVIAEGVEGWSQLEMLRKLGCRYAQGYLFSPPVAAAEVWRSVGQAPELVAQPVVEARAG
jgi:EAL domain-containing protein (putative c-di-GMP-specific phosphodiesterase class I)